MEFLYALPALLALLVVGFEGTKTKRLERRVAMLERKLDAALEQLGVQPHDPTLVRSGHLPEIERLLREGKKIQAIKVYRDATGADLSTAKSAVERMGAPWT